MQTVEVTLLETEFPQVRNNIPCQMSKNPADLLVFCWSPTCYLQELGG